MTTDEAAVHLNVIQAVQAEKQKAESAGDAGATID